ncbi:MAG: hypothetical protein IPM51_11680 [Sphingobacteriaceae bacterium]|nr:hypothetical protein [Sphingobacteriaceae bacterium]
MIINKNEVSFIIFQNAEDKKLNKINIWVQHASDFQDTYDHLVSIGVSIAASNPYIKTFAELMPLISVALLCSMSPLSTEYIITLSGASINQVKNENQLSSNNDNA